MKRAQLGSILEIVLQHELLHVLPVGDGQDGVALRALDIELHAVRVVLVEQVL